MAANAVSVDDMVTTSLVKLLATAAALQSPPFEALPQQTTEPSAFIAANAVAVDNTDTTFVRFLPDESPPLELLPQVTTEPSALITANAESVDDIDTALTKLSVTALESPPLLLSPQVTTLPLALIAAKAVFVFALLVK